MVATEIAVTVRGNLGLDDPTLLADRLAEKTGVQWAPKEPNDSHLAGGIAEIILIVALTKATELSVEQIVAGAKTVLAELKERWVSPPTTEIEQRTVAEPDENPEQGEAEQNGAED
ncbi:hypothetical protein [Streptomyces fractus]|uniref:hypothetical protein n=1 Tax=Streptomyces fractus TaxID=641806 RepID=UPI003CF8EBD4